MNKLILALCLTLSAGAAQADSRNLTATTVTRYFYAGNDITVVNITTVDRRTDVVRLTREQRRAIPATAIVVKDGIAIGNYSEVRRRKK